MTTIKATCPFCGEVDLTAEDIVLKISAKTETNSYSFACPGCGDTVQKPADRRVVRLLLSGGVVPVPVHIPAEVLEAKPGPPLTHDDLLDFHYRLQKDDWLDELLDGRIV